jgi:DUF4097 and DUF4098 domain-containing protein YvlB
MTRTRTAVVVVLAAVSVCVTASCATGQSAGKRTDRLSYHNVDTIVIENTQGHVHITAGRGNSVSVKRTTQTLLAKTTNSAYVDDHRVLRLRSICHGTACEVDYTITTPANVRFQISDKNATVAINAAPGNVAVANTAEGDITFDLTAAPHLLSASTHKGGIAVSVPHGAYDVTARAANGNKTVAGITVHKHGRHTVVASADNGDITINGH